VIAPTARLEVSDEHGAEVVIARGSASIVPSSGPVEDDADLRLAAGESARLGLSTLRVAARARVTLEVRNIFGNRARRQEDVIVAVPTPLEHVASVDGASVADARRSAGGAR